jgi:hypothetical protein
MKASPDAALCSDRGDFHFLIESNGNRKPNASKDGSPVRAQILLKAEPTPAKASFDWDFFAEAVDERDGRFWH